VAEPDVDLLHALLTDPQVRRHLLDGQTVSRDFVARAVAASIRSFEQRNWGLYAVTDAKDGALLGLCGFHMVGTPPERQLVYALRPSAWGQGRASEAVQAVATHALSTLRFADIIAATDAPNTASIAVLGKCGFRPTEELIERGRAIIRFRRERAR
jgi:RimJ/RimL family protein N-acetyltransferase